ncbi:hypothetical protein Ocin01_18617 [Orchesella cincta]|uniref:Uncharacterized protein n=1 Tax=Orchesella cincta TaxID=48709 RepID=A0A1D2M519_ORCCI|nr:hypothetical protein Ocin01_18617 [Orchesella cincta]
MTAILIRCNGVLCVFLMGFVTVSLMKGAQSTDNLTALGTVRGKSYFANGVIHLGFGWLQNILALDGHGSKLVRESDNTTN